MTNLFNNSLIAALSFLFVMAFSPLANATDNPFGMNNSNTSQLQLADKEGKCGGEMKTDKKKGKCGEGKCGGKMKSEKKGKCGDSMKKEGKCGDSMKAEKKEGKCGSGMKKEGKCGGSMKTGKKKGKCGEGKCGGKK